jgi:hypothetical protein
MGRVLVLGLVAVIAALTVSWLLGELLRQRKR